MSSRTLVHAPVVDHTLVHEVRHRTDLGAAFVPMQIARP